MRRQVLIVLTSFVLGGCVRIGGLEQGDILGELSELILRPDQECDELREWFGLSYLPVVSNPAEAGLKYEEDWLAVDGETLVRVWYLPTRLDRGTVVYSCGNAGPMNCYLFAADLLTDIGWSVVIYEYEGFGLSGGEASLAVLSRDLEAVVDWARSATGREQVTLMGVSLGSVPSVAVAVKRPEAVNGVILDSPIALAAQIRRFELLVNGQGQELIDELDGDLISDTLIGRLEQPMLVLLHEEDVIATPETVEALYREAAGPRTVIRFAGLGHALSQFVRTDAYMYYVDRFLTEVWAEAGSEEPAGADEL
jgi:fermentation-respiration switch protein FrsA (DUF1100 family)